MMPAASPLEAVRLDVWLWAARFYKTRSLAKSAIVGGKIEVDGQAAKPSRSVRGGEKVAIVRGEERMEVSVHAIADARHAAPIAQQLYRESDGSRVAREAARALRAASRAGYRPPPERPDKRARRDLIDLDRAGEG